MSLAAYCRDRTNPYMFIYALSVVVIHKPETRGLELPSHAEMFPSLYMDSSVFNRAREESEVVQAGSRVSYMTAVRHFEFRTRRSSFGSASFSTNYFSGVYVCVCLGGG